MAEPGEGWRGHYCLIVCDVDFSSDTPGTSIVVIVKIKCKSYGVPSVANAIPSLYLLFFDINTLSTMLASRANVLSAKPGPLRRTVSVGQPSRTRSVAVCVKPTKAADFQGLSNGEWNAYNNLLRWFAAFLWTSPCFLLCVGENSRQLGWSA